MIEVVLSLVAAVFFIIGVADVIHILKRKVLSPDSPPKTHLTVYLSGDTPDLQLASIVNEYNWYSHMRPESIVAVYTYIDTTTLQNCKEIAEKHNIILKTED